MQKGPELVRVALADWAEEHVVQLDYILPGKPAQDSYIECFNQSYLEEVRDLAYFPA